MTEAVPTWLPFGFLEWMPLLQAAALGALTFVQEDVPTVSAALLAAAGNLSWGAAFWGCFLGIWLGDALLYAMARLLGRPVLERPLVRRFFNAASVARSERWFDRKGTWLLVSSRFLPGSRLPTYLAAGFLRLNAAKFLSITGVAVLVWTALIFTIAKLSGPALLGLFKKWNTGAAAVSLLILVCLTAIFLIRSFAAVQEWRRMAAFVHRWTRWEFWPAWLFYAPVAVNYVLLSFRYRSFTVPTSANPGIFSGGIVGESKMETLCELQTTSPLFVAKAKSVNRIEDLPSEYPFILKPDIGQRGAGVKLIRSHRQAVRYLEGITASLIAQDYAAGPHEVGIFYYRFPGQPQGKIFAITEKIFPFVTGDGEKTVEDLIWSDPRARCVAKTYLKRLRERRHEIPSMGKIVKLVEAGNHAQGCEFRNGKHLCSEELEKRIDEISQKLNGFFIGRYDIRFASEADLRAGRNFQIIELNGAAAEATSIYDARNSLISAYRTLFKQWGLVFAIGAANRRNGAVPTKANHLWRSWRETSALIATYPIAD